MFFLPTFHSDTDAPKCSAVGGARKRAAPTPDRGDHSRPAAVRTTHTLLALRKWAHSLLQNTTCESHHRFKAGVFFSVSLEMLYDSPPPPSHPLLSPLHMLLNPPAGRSLPDSLSIGLSVTYPDPESLRKMEITQMSQCRKSRVPCWIPKSTDDPLSPHKVRLAFQSRMKPFLVSDPFACYRESLQRFRFPRRSSLRVLYVFLQSRPGDGNATELCAPFASVMKVFHTFSQFYVHLPTLVCRFYGRSAE